MDNEVAKKRYECQLKVLTAIEEQVELLSDNGQMVGKTKIIQSGLEVLSHLYSVIR